jgi:hypothetical protein
MNIPPSANRTKTTIPLATKQPVRDFFFIVSSSFFHDDVIQLARSISICNLRYIIALFPTQYKTFFTYLRIFSQSIAGHKCQGQECIKAVIKFYSVVAT